MCTANEVALEDTVNGARLFTFTASGTFRVIDSSKVVNDLYSTVRTGALTFTASYTAVFTSLTNLSAFIMAAAKNSYALGILYQMNNSFESENPLMP